MRFTEMLVVVAFFATFSWCAFLTVDFAKFRDTQATTRIATKDDIFKSGAWKEGTLDKMCIKREGAWYHVEKIYRDGSWVSYYFRSNEGDKK